MRSVPSNRASTPAAVLLVDDNCDGTMARRTVLEHLGFTVISATSGELALEALEKRNFDLVVTDYLMSPMNGVELIRNFRERNFRNPIILLTGFADNLGLSPENTGADAIVQKSSYEISNLVRQATRLLTARKKPPGSHRPSKQENRKNL
jgi:CheY-like chemotaxis protein